MSGQHGHASAAQGHRRPLTVVLAVTVTIVAIEVVGALVSDSLTLLADAGHLLTDAFGIGLTLFAIVCAGRPATQARTFGYLRVEILSALANALLLFGVGGFVLYEAVRRLVSPPDVSSGVMLVFGLVALVGNACSLAMLRVGQGESLNIRAAYLEVLSDLFGAVAVIAAALVISVTGFARADPIASAMIGLLILPRTWRLLRQAVDVLLEATPRGVDLAAVRRHMVETEGVIDVHDLHAWTITSGVNVLSAHVVVRDDAHGGRTLDRLGECLSGHFDIEHSTFQLEPAGHRDHEQVLHR